MRLWLLGAIKGLTTGCARVIVGSSRAMPHPIHRGSPMFKNEWFEGRQAIQAPPLDCVLALGSAGHHSHRQIGEWVDRLDFDGPAWLIREYLRGTGAWERRELCDHNANCRRLLWLWCCDLAEQFGPDFKDFCGDGEEDKPLPATLYLMR